MPSNCSLELDVYHPASLSDDEYTEDTIDWTVSTDQAHAFPFLLAPRSYAEQEIDPISCTASIGTVEVGVIDALTNPDDQTTGWMTARVHGLFGRRCRLRRYVNATIGWVVIADGPAGTPRMDASYAAYRWTIRDTRDTERQMQAFTDGGTTALVPRGSIYDWGFYEDDDGEHYLLPGLLTTEDGPVVGNIVHETGLFGYTYVDFRGHQSGSPNVIDDPRLVVNDTIKSAFALMETGSGKVTRHVDILWREIGGEWNVARPRQSSVFTQELVQFGEARLDPADEEPVPVIDFVLLRSDDQSVEDDFPESDTTVEVIVRYRGPASEEFPHYVEGELGDVLMGLYDGDYTRPQNTGILGNVYEIGRAHV